MTTWKDLQKQTAISDEAKEAIRKANTYDGLTGIDDDEVRIPVGDGGFYLVFPSSQKDETGVDYVRITEWAAPHSEVVYWTASEWADAPKEVMGAIMGAIQNGVPAKIRDADKSS